MLASVWRESVKDDVIIIDGNREKLINDVFLIKICYIYIHV